MDTAATLPSSTVTQSTGKRHEIDVPSPIPDVVAAPDTISSGTQPVQAGSGQVPQADIIVTARPRNSPDDPLAGVNARSFRATQAIEDAIVGPLAHGYEHAVPSPVRGGVRNFLENLHEPDVFVNYILQLKPGKAAETLGRFVINSTLGVGGVIDVAKRRPFRMPRRPNGFGDTFGYYGVKPGPFIFLPVIGATTPRDLVGLVMDRLLLPLAVGRPFNKLAYSIPTGVLHTLDRRDAFDEQLRQVRETANPYVARRELYLRSRREEIDRLHGRPARNLSSESQAKSGVCSDGVSDCGQP